MRGEYTDYTRSHHHPGAQFWVGSSRNWSVFRERPNTGRHEKAPVRCPCNRLAALHGDPRTPPLTWPSLNNVHLLTSDDVMPQMKTVGVFENSAHCMYSIGLECI